MKLYRPEPGYTVGSFMYYGTLGVVSLIVFVGGYGVFLGLWALFRAWFFSS